MTSEEASKLIYTIKAVYPRHFAKYTTQDYKNMISAWCLVLDGISYRDASIGLTIYLSSDTKGFPPSPGQVIDCLKKNSAETRRQPTSNDAWTHIERAIRNGIYGAEEEFEKLTPAEQRAIGNPANIRTLAQREMSASDESVEKATFIRAYERELQRQEEDRKIPRNIMALIEMSEKKYDEMRLETNAKMLSLPEPEEDWAKAEFNKTDSEEDDLSDTGMSEDTRRQYEELMKEWA